jgi:alanine racemase
MIPSRCWVEVDVDKVARNYHRLRDAAGAPLLCVVKADAYGHGAARVAQRLEREGAAAFAVATAEEGVALRTSGVRGSILILGGVLDFEFDAMFAHHLTPVVHDVERLGVLNRQAAGRGEVWPYHFKVDSGMGRMGSKAAEEEIAAAIRACPNLRLEGLLTHLATTSEEITPQTRMQYERFESALEKLAALGVAAPAIHAAASVPVIHRHTAPRANLVRPGLALYGYPASHMEPALSWKTRILLVKELQPGEPVGYGARWRASRPSRIAVIACGYADGVPHRLIEPAEVLIRGCRAPVVGAVSMDLLTVDVTDCPAAGLHDVATMIGEDGGHCITAEDWARCAGTIPYVILCSISKRVRRVYRS